MRELGGEPLPEPIYNHNLNLCFFDANQLINIKHKCSPVSDERCLHSNELFVATIPPQVVCDSNGKLLNPQGLIRSADLKKRSS